MNLAQRIGAVVGSAPSRIDGLSGGCVGEVHRASFVDRPPLVAKVDREASGQLRIEGFMLEYLAARLPVPAVVHADQELLLMEWIPGSSSFSSGAEEHAAELLAGLHGVTAEGFGFERDTLIGGLHQPNPWSADWIPFFAEQRLSYMAAEACRAGRLDASVVSRVEALAGRLCEFLDEPEAPALVHGDVWSGNVLAVGERIVGFLDPAIYFGHAEVELAFITMFHTFGERFFHAYREQREVAPRFMEERRHLYNLYPYLVHVRLFGGGYVAAVHDTLDRFGV